MPRMSLSIRDSKYMRLCITDALSAGYLVFMFRKSDTGRKDTYTLDRS